MISTTQSLNAAPARPLRVRAISDDRALAAIAPAWNRLAGDNPFRRFEWAFAWWRAFGNSDRKLAVVVCEDSQGTVIAIAPFYRESSWSRGACMALLGSGKACGDDLSLLVDPRREHDAEAAVADWLADPIRSGHWDTLSLDGIATNDPHIERLCRSLAAQGAHVALQTDVSRWIVDLPSDWEEYVTRLGKRTRRLVRQTLRSCHDPAQRVSVRRPRSEAEFATMFDALAELHGRRWESAGEAGVFASADFDQFLREMAKAWYAQGALRLHVLSVDGVAASAAIGVRRGEVYSAYLLGRDPRFDVLRPGWMLNLCLIRGAIAEGASQFDFLRGDEPYKAHLGCAPTPQCRIVVTGGGALNRLRAASRSLGRNALSTGRTLQKLAMSL